MDRAKAAHAVGIPSIGVLWDDPLTPEILKYTEIPEVEWIELSRPVTLDMDATLGKLADEYGVTLVKTGLCSPDYPVDWAALNLRRLVDIAARYGLTVAVEPVAWGNTSSLGKTLGMMTQAGVADRDNVGICYDLWQIAYGSRISERYHLPKVAKVEVSGIKLPKVDSSLIEAAMDRPLLADSEYETSDWVNRVTANLDYPVVTYEVPSAHLRDLSLLETAQIVAEDMEVL